MAHEKTRHAVNRIANQMICDGIEPTIRNVREAIGYGSVTTIGPALRDWRLGIFRGVCDKSRKQNLPDNVIALAGELWEMAKSESSKKFGQEKTELLRLLSTAIEQRNEIENRVNALEEQVRNLEKSS